MNFVGNIPNSILMIYPIELSEILAFISEFKD